MLSRLANAVTENRASGFGFGPRLSPSVLNEYLKTICYGGVSKDDFFVLERAGGEKLIITNSAHDLSNAQQDSVNPQASGKINIKAALDKVLSDEELKSREKLDIIIPFAQALPYVSLMPSFTRGHYSMLYLKYNLKTKVVEVINYDSKSYYSSAIYPINHILVMIKESIPEATVRVATEHLNWQTVFDNSDCGRFVLVMIKQLIDYPQEAISKLTASQATEQVKAWATIQEEGKVAALIACVPFQDKAPLKDRLAKCLLRFYTNVDLPNDNELRVLYLEYTNVLSQMQTENLFNQNNSTGFIERLAEKNFNYFRTSIEEALGSTAKYPKLQGVYEVHRQFAETNKWKELNMAYAIPLTAELNMLLSSVGSYFGSSSAASASTSTQLSTLPASTSGLSISNGTALSLPAKEDNQVDI